ncbi:MAG: hypothetical protein N2039_03335 [Gemmataceae bacterium]|nr:hypothetical protein [Gemmataceae bacterium]
MPEADIPEKVVAELATLFHRNGYVRRQNPERRVLDGPLYKKGDEVRLTAQTFDELRKIRRLLKEAGFKIGRWFRHSHQWRQPVYGREQVARFLSLVGDRPSKEPDGPRPRLR